MLTWPTYGARYFRQINGRAHWVVKIVKDASTWLFSTADMQLTDGHVYSLLASEPSIESEVDYVTKQWSVQDVRLAVKNIPYKQNTSHAWVSFADECGEIRAATLSIYVLAGVSPTALSDGLLVFSGEVSGPATVTGNEIQLSAVDGAWKQNIVLPQRYITDTGGISTPSNLRKAPLIWGQFTKTYNSAIDLGLVLCEPIYGTSGTNYLVADHPCHSISSAFWSQSQLPHPSKVFSPTLTADSGGRATINLSNTAGSYGQVHADAYLFVDGQYQGAQSDSDGYDGVTYSSTVYPQRAGDLDLTSYATVIDNLATANVHAHAYFGWPDYDRTDNAYTNAIGLIGAVPPGTAANLTLEWNITLPDITGTAYIELLGLASTAITSTITSGANGSLTFDKVTREWDNYVFWHPRSGRSSVYSSNLPIIAVVRMDSTKTPSVAGREVFRVNYIRLVIRYIPSFGFQYVHQTIRNNAPPSQDPVYTTKTRKYKAPQSEGLAFVAVQGRDFGPWIEEGGRSSSYVEGDCIEDPAYIIESILRDEIGMASSEIDTASFDAAANPLVKSRLHLNSETSDTAMSIIRQLAEQSTFAFAVSGVSKPRLINLKIDAPPIARTLTATDVDIPSIVVSKGLNILNNLRIEHKFMEEYGGFQVSSEYSNATSIAKFGAYPQDFSWPNITSSTTDSLYEVADLLRDLWSGERVTVSATLPGSYNCDLEVGDWIQFDSATIDPHNLCYGESWSGKLFLLSRVRHTPTSTVIEGLNVSEEPPSATGVTCTPTTYNITLPVPTFYKGL